MNLLGRWKLNPVENQSNRQISITTGRLSCFRWKLASSSGHPGSRWAREACNCGTLNWLCLRPGQPGEPILLDDWDMLRSFGLLKLSHTAIFTVSPMFKTIWGLVTVASQGCTDEHGRLLRLCQRRLLTREALLSRFEFLSGSNWIVLHAKESSKIWDGLNIVETCSLQTLTLLRVWLQVAMKIKLMLFPQSTYCS